MNNQKLLDELKEQERSIAFLARKCGITRAYMHKMIHGKRNFSELYKQKCADVLRIRYKELFDA
jgi:plasmid maintenance system antidote protein VapI